MQKIVIAKPIVLALLLTPLCSLAAVRESNPSVPDVVTAFNALKHHGEAMGFNMGAGAPLAPGPGRTDDPTGKTHYQGIQRWQAPGLGTPYLFVTRAGVTDSDRANMLIVRMGTREPAGERMRSNRLLKDKSTNETPPPASDVVVQNWNFAGWHHVGGVQLAGDILAVPLEDPHGCRDCETGQVVFLNVENPANSVQLSYTLNISGHKAGVVGITKLPEPDGHFLMVLAWDKNDKLEFYRSTRKSFFESGFEFRKHDEWDAGELLGAFNEWPHGSPTCYQSLSLVNQGDGKIFMIGARNTSELTPIVNGEDRLAVFEILGYQANVMVTNVAVLQRAPEKHVWCNSAGDATTPPPVRIATLDVNADFLSASGTYVSPSGELLLYAAEHWNDGVNRSVRMVEFRHQKGVRDNNPVYSKQVDAGGKYTLGEGSSVTLIGTNSVPAAVRPWVELYDDDNFNDRSVMIDWPDRDRDDYKDIRKLDGFNDKTTSVRWWAPVGWIIRLHNQDNWGMDESFIDLFGTGAVGSYADLGNYSFNDKVTSVQFFASANHPYASPLTFAWKLLSPPSGAGDLLDPSNPLATFNAVNGPNTVNVQLELGPAPIETDTTQIVITNVPPAISGITIAASSIQTGRVDLVVNFTDPGLKDMHDLRITWGDGAVSNLVSAMPVRSFTSHHVYQNSDPMASNRLTFTISLRLRDDADEVNTNRAVTITFYDSPSIADIDGDGLADTWEDFYLGDRNSTGAQDNDGDGQSNLAEYIAGTDPLDSQDALTLRIGQTGAEHDISFLGHRTGGIGYGTRARYYTIECATNITGSWRPVGALNNVPASDGLIHLLQPSPGGAMQFYRVRAAFEIIPALDGLRHWWRGENNGLDSIGLRHRTFTTAGYTNGFIGRAFAFDGVNDEAGLPGGSEPRIIGAWTASFWVYRQDALAGNSALLLDSGFALKAEQSGTPRRVGFTRFGALGTDQNYSFNYTIPAQTWTHLVFVSAGGVTQLFANGLLQDTVNTTIPLPLKMLGGEQNNRFRGHLDEVGTYDRALTASEVQALYDIESGR